VWSGSSTNFTDSGLVSGAYYNYRVKARNEIGLAPESEVVTGIAGSLSAQIQSQTILLQSKNLLTIGWDALTLTQSGGLPVTNYLVRSDNSDFILGTP